jgi:probable HAF family extracellular repeat protein
VRDRNGAFTTIDVPGAMLTFPLGINDRGHVVGMYRDANQVGHGFLYRDGAITMIDHPLASSDLGPGRRRPGPDRWLLRAQRVGQHGRRAQRRGE